MDQRSDEWHAFRLGNVSASRIADVMAKSKSGGDSATRKNYMMELLCQRLTGKREEGFTTAAMQRGIDLESIAASEYEAATGLFTDECGAFAHPDIFGFVASPDRLVGDDGLLEIKCPNTAQHVDFIVTGKIPTQYQWQMLAQMACTGRTWVDYASYDDRMPEGLQLRVKRFLLSENIVKYTEMLEAVKEFLAELEQLIDKVRQHA